MESSLQDILIEEITKASSFERNPKEESSISSAVKVASDSEAGRQVTFNRELIKADSGEKNACGLRPQLGSKPHSSNKGVKLASADMGQYTLPDELIKLANTGGVTIPVDIRDQFIKLLGV
jgi:hypothetical protein